MMKVLKWTTWTIVCLVLIGTLMSCSQEQELKPVEGTAVSSHPEALPVLTGDRLATTPSKLFRNPDEGTWIIGMEENNQTLLMRIGEQFELRLREGYIWDVSLDDPGVIILVESGDQNGANQGVYQATNLGETMLRASGDPPCRRETPACMLPSLLFELKIQVVEP